jgi:hypothetical protein
MTADTAEVLLRQYMERFTNFYRGAASPASAGEAAPPSPLPSPLKKRRKKRVAKRLPEPPTKRRTKRKINYPATRKPAVRVRKGPLSKERQIFDEYLSAHSGPFRADELTDWASQKGHAYDRSKLLSILYNTANAKKALTSNGQGQYTRV